MALRFYHVVLIVGALFLDSAQAQSPDLSPHSGAYWHARLMRVHVHMSRAQAERILRRTDTARGDTPSALARRLGGAHTSLYFLDTRWCAAITYDWHGFDPDPRRNPNTLLHLYEHRVLAPPVLLARDAALDARLNAGYSF